MTDAAQSDAATSARRPRPPARGTRPAGTVTFLVTDIEGSTKLWQSHRDDMPGVIARHDFLLRQVIEGHQGVVFQTVGDATHAAFSSARDGLEAALAAQRALLAGSWPDGIELRVRMALHTGPIELRDGEYVGHTLNRVARLLSAGHGGQILVSAATQELVCDAPPAGVELRDLGNHRLKDLVRPEHIYQVVASELPATFPPLITADVGSTNLPTQPTSFIGRERERREIVDLLRQEQVRLVTLTGPGGTGKTRLSLQVGVDAGRLFPDGVIFVPLAPIADPAMVTKAVATALGVQEVSEQPLEETIISYLLRKRMLLILDNFEHLLEAAGVVGAILMGTIEPKVLATSRSVLHLSAEHNYPVPPLQLPDLRHLPGVSDLSRYEAVALFVQRAQAVKPGFSITSDNARVVAEICFRLDGLPLAIELAAARMRLFPPRALLERLQQRLPLLTGRARDAPARQQTLRATLDWSYDLLTQADKQVLWRLSVFAGGWDLEAAESVCNPKGDLDVLGGMESLIDKSLVRLVDRPDGEPRFSMLHIIKEYGLDRLTEGGEAESIARLHGDYFVRFAEAGQSGLQGPEQEHWLARLELEQDNCRAALENALSHCDPETALRFGGALSLLYWYGHGDWQEGRRWLEQALTLPGAAKVEGPRARALAGLANLCQLLNDFDAARRYAQEALRLGEQLDDSWVVVWADISVAWVDAWEGDLQTARDLSERALALARSGSTEWVLANGLHHVGAVAVLQKDYELGQRYLHESVARHRQLHDRWALPYELNTLGDSYRLQGDYRRAAEHYQESLRWFEEGRNKGGIASVLHNLGYVNLHEGNDVRATEQFREALTSFQELGDRRGVAECALGLGAVAVARGQPERAARLFAAGQRALTDVGAVLSHSNDADYERYLAQLKVKLDDGTFEAAWQAGSGMSYDVLLAYALSDEPDLQAPAPQVAV